MIIYKGKAYDAQKLGEIFGRVGTLLHATQLLQEAGVPKNLCTFIYKGSLKWVFARVFVLGKPKFSKN